MLQYRLRTLLLVTLAVAVLCWVSFVLPDPIGVFTLFATLTIVPGLTAAGIVYFRGYQRAFWVGAAPAQFLLAVFLFPLIWSLGYEGILSFRGIDWSSDGVLIKAHLLSAIAIIVVSGFGGMLIRYLSIANIGS